MELVPASEFARGFVRVLCDEERAAQAITYRMGHDSRETSNAGSGTRDRWEESDVSPGVRDRRQHVRVDRRHQGSRETCSSGVHSVGKSVDTCNREVA